VLESVAAQFMAGLAAAGGAKLTPPQLDKITAAAFTNKPDAGGCSHAVLNRALVGADPAVLAQHAGAAVPNETQLLFAETTADYTILEVGLGGRLDATNVVDTPALCVITPVDMDHQQYLGDTLGRIAGEKAGIIKRGVPVIVGRQQDAGLEVIEAVAARLGAPIHAYGQHWHVWSEAGRLVFQDENGLLDLPKPALLGAHQIENAGIALAALRVMGKPEAACEAAMTKAVWPARMQRLRHGPLFDIAPRAELWLDGGHNPHAARAIAALLAGMPARPTHLICGMLNTKDVTGYMAPLAGVAQSLHAVSIPGQAATLTASDTAAAARAAGLAAQEADSVAAALASLTAQTPDARILICGSLYLAGEILKENG
jgi:dihydrofolate synthase/folylpolyglutamate synthase